VCGSALDVAASPVAMPKPGGPLDLSSLMYCLQPASPALASCSAAVRRGRLEMVGTLAIPVPSSNGSFHTGASATSENPPYPLSHLASALFPVV